MPAFLTPEQFQKTTASRKPGATYQGYRQWVTKTRAKRAAGAGRTGGAGIPGGNQVLGFGQVDPRALWAQAQSLFRPDSTYAPLTDAQITSQASNIVNPLFQKAIEGITGAIGKQTEAGRNAIAGYGQSYLNSLPAIQSQVSGIYDQAKGEQSSVNATLANFIRDQGARATDAISQANAQVGGTGGGIAPTAAMGAGASAANLAYGGSTLENLIGQGAAENAYTAQLPAFARAQQTQTLGNFLAGQQSSLEQQTNSLTQQLPQTLSDTYQSLVNRELQKAQGRQSAQGQMADFYNQGLTRNMESSSLAAQLQQSGISNQQFTKNLDFQKTQETHRVQEAKDNLQWQKDNAKANRDAKNDPMAGQSLSQRLQKILPDLAGTAYNLSQVPVNKNGRVVGKATSWGSIRKRITALIKGQFGPKIPAATLKYYVEQAMYGGGWPGPSQPQQGSPYFGGGLAGGGGLPMGFGSGSFFGLPLIGPQAGPEQTPGVGPVYTNTGNPNAFGYPFN